MPIITFISDFGTTDHYVASVKGSVLKYNPNNKIVDISHEVNKYCLLYTSPSPRDVEESRMPSSA